MKNSISLLFFGLLVTCLLSLTPAQARDGGETGGGGDPIANEFLEYGRNIQKILVGKHIPEVNIDGKVFQRKLDMIQTSLDGNAPRLIFPDGKLVDCYGVPKVGCVIQNKIHIARRGYMELSISSKHELVALEIFRLMEIEDRYPKALAVSEFLKRTIPNINSGESITIPLLPIQSYDVTSLPPGSKIIFNVEIPFSKDISFYGETEIFNDGKMESSTIECEITNSTHKEYITNTLTIETTYRSDYSNSIHMKEGGIVLSCVKDFLRRNMSGSIIVGLFEKTITRVSYRNQLLTDSLQIRFVKNSLK